MHEHGETFSLDVLRTSRCSECAKPKNWSFLHWDNILLLFVCLFVALYIYPGFWKRYRQVDQSKKIKIKCATIVFFSSPGFFLFAPRLS